VKDQLRLSQRHPPERVLDWELSAGVGAGSQWGCWKAEGGAWRPCDERRTELLKETAERKS